MPHKELKYPRQIEVWLEDWGKRLMEPASFHKCDYLLTWNCQHLANANKFGHIRRINALVNLPTPELVTPLELTEE